jgi:hypothetical protein
MGEPNNAYKKIIGEETTWRRTISKIEEEMGG